MSPDLSAEFTVFVSGEREMFETLICIALFGLIIACAGLFSMWGFAVEREHELREQNRKLKSLAKGLEDDRNDFRERFLDLDPAFRQLEDYAEKTDAEVSKLKDELEECKLARLQTETMCNTLEEQAIRFSKSNVELGEKILKYKSCIDVLLKRLSMIRDVSHGLPPFQETLALPDNADNASDSVSPE